MNTSRPRYALSLLAGAQFMDVLDFSIVQVALPTIRADLDMSASAASWVVSMYALTYAGFPAAVGPSHRRPRAPAAVPRRAGDLHRGLGAGSRRADRRRPDRRARSAGLPRRDAHAGSPGADHGAVRRAGTPSEGAGDLGATGSSGVAVGLLLGGVFTAGFGWRAVFIINVPLGIAALAMTGRLLEPDGARAPQRLDVPGAVTATLASLLLVSALTGAEHAGLFSARTVVLAVAGLAATAGFVCIEPRSASPLVPLTMFRSARLRTGNAVAFLASAAFAAQFLLVSLYPQQVAGFEALASGLVFLPMALLLAVASGKASPRAVQRFGLRTTMIAGASTMAAGMALFALTVTATPAYVTTVLPALALVAAGQGLTWTAF